MSGSSHQPGSSAGSGLVPAEEVRESAGGLAEILRRLAADFGAPVGLLDPRRGTWLLRPRAQAQAFPALGPGVVGASAAHGRAIVWKGEEAAGRLWLLVPIEGPEGPLVAAAGFATGDAPRPGSSARWGAPCPESALRAWGQAVADQSRPVERPTRLPGPLPAAAVADGAPAPAPAPGSSAPEKPARGDRLLVARLIRRMRIADHPVKFQQLAAQALKTALNVEAVAWVPAHRSDGGVVACGGVGRVQGSAFRALVPADPGRGPVVIAGGPTSPPHPEVRHVLAVAAEAPSLTGWLLAVNPLDGRPFDDEDGEALRPIASLIATQQVNARIYADLKDLLFGVIRALTAAIDAKDPYTSGHSERVARIAVRLGQELGMSANQRGDLYLMGLLHDVGKIGVDDSVLKKAGPLTPEEYRKIQLHVDIGVHILSDLKKLNHLLPGVRHHHESLDGSGYPCGLAGDAIPFEARILAVADSYDAMSSTRPYRRRLTSAQIDEIFRKGSGVQWDPRVVDALFACRLDLELIRQKGLGESLQVAVSETLGRT